jgi:hypothetical protein
MEENQLKKNIKISNKHHNMLKEISDNNGIKVYRIVEKLIENYYHSKKEGTSNLTNIKTGIIKKDIYGEN